MSVFTNGSPALLMAANSNVIVIGGGAIGCSAAYYLARLGWKVRLLDANRIGCACSYGNCGFVCCTSYILPLNVPGAIWQVAAKMFVSDSAVYIKPRLDIALWSWLAKFAFHCRREPMMHAARARHALLASSIKLYYELLAEESIDVEWVHNGVLFVYKSQREFESYARTAELLHNEFDIEIRRYDSSQLAVLEPALRSGLGGGWHFPGDAHLRPDRLMSSFPSVLKSLGVEIVENVTVDRIDVSNGSARAVETSCGPMTSDVFVLATGAESARFSTQLGSRIPIQPGKGYTITVPRLQESPMIPLVFQECHVALAPWSSGLRIGSTMEFVGFDRSLNRRRIGFLQRAASEYLNGSVGGPIQEECYGWRPMTYDGLPCIGRAPKAANVIVAAGHGMIGIATMTATGKLVSEIASGREPHIDPSPFALSRFGR